MVRRCFLQTLEAFFYLEFRTRKKRILEQACFPCENPLWLLQRVWRLGSLLSAISSSSGCFCIQIKNRHKLLVDHYNLFYLPSNILVWFLVAIIARNPVADEPLSFEMIEPRAAKQPKPPNARQLLNEWNVKVYAGVISAVIFIFISYHFAGILARKFSRSPKSSRSSGISVLARTSR